MTNVVVSPRASRLETLARSALSSRPFFLSMKRTTAWLRPYAVTTFSGRPGPATKLASTSPVGGAGGAVGGAAVAGSVGAGSVDAGAGAGTPVASAVAGAGVVVSVAAVSAGGASSAPPPPTTRVKRRNATSNAMTPTTTAWMTGFSLSARLIAN